MTANGSNAALAVVGRTDQSLVSGKLEPGDPGGRGRRVRYRYGRALGVSGRHLRSLVRPGRRPSDEQKRLYDLAQAQVLFNIETIRPGLSFREFAERCWPVPDAFVPNRYMMMVHGVGFVDEYPSIAYVQDFDAWGYDGMFEENMVVCVESYMGEVGGQEGIKLEQQVLITSAGAVRCLKSAFVERNRTVERA